jgi:serine/threonine-protein kinase
MALEYIDGRDVSWLIKKKGRLPIDFCLHVVKQVARALEHAHKNGFVHRDIKPSNIMITRAKIAKLTDLGLARQLEEMEDQKITRDGYTLGTVDYMSPEQSRNSHAADIRSDIYSLGCAWFHMLTGEAPYGEGTTVERLRRHAYDPIPNVRDKAPEVPEDMSFVIEKMMEKDPKSRYQNPTELLEALDQLDPNRRSMDSESIALLAAIERGEEVDVSKDRSKSATKDAGRRGARKTPAESDEIPIAQISHGPQRRPTAPSVRPVSSMTTVAYFAIGCIIGLVVLAIVLRGGSSGAVTPTTSLPTPADAATEAPALTPDQETVTVPLRKSVP